MDHVAFCTTVLRELGAVVFGEAAADRQRFERSTRYVAALRRPPPSGSSG